MAALVGDYEFTNHPEDIELLNKMLNAAAAFCLFILPPPGCSASKAGVKPRD